MAVLDAANRLRTAAQWMRENAVTVTGVAKADLRAAVDATDQWIEDNQTAYNTALPATVRTGLTLPQKTLLFCFVAMRRAGRLRAEEDG